jgi:hypothetical protein
LDGTQATEGEALQFWSGDVVWNISADTGKPTASPAYVAFFDSDDCSGDPWVPYATPRFAIAFRGMGAQQDTYLVRPDDLQISHHCGLTAEFFSPSTCLSSTSTCIDGFNLSDFDEVQFPTESWTPPLHPEPIQ